MYRISVTARTSSRAAHLSNQNGEVYRSVVLKVPTFSLPTETDREKRFWSALSGAVWSSQAQSSVLAVVEFWKGKRV